MQKMRQQNTNKDQKDEMKTYNPKVTWFLQRVRADQKVKTGRKVFIKKRTSLDRKGNRRELWVFSFSDIKIVCSFLEYWKMPIYMHGWIL